MKEEKEDEEEERESQMYFYNTVYKLIFDIIGKFRYQDQKRTQDLCYIVFTAL